MRIHELINIIETLSSNNKFENLIGSAMGTIYNILEKITLILMVTNKSGKAILC